MQCEEVNMDNYRLYHLAMVWCFQSSEQDLTREVLYSSGASIGPGDGHLNGCTSCDGDSDDNATFSFQSCLGCGLDFGVLGSLFSTPPSYSLFGS